MAHPLPSCGCLPPGGNETWARTYLLMVRRSERPGFLCKMFTFLAVRNKHELLNNTIVGHAKHLQVGFSPGLLAICSF